MAGNDLNFLADLLPSAIVKVITIETRGGMVELETNPHIVEETVPVFKRAELQRTLGTEGGATLEALLKSLGGDLSSTSWSGADLAAAGASMGMQTSNKQSTMITLRCAVRDTIDHDDTAGQWFMSGDITKYLYIAAVQFSSKKAVDVYKKLLKASGPTLQIAHAYLAGGISTDELMAQNPPIPGAGNLTNVKNSISLKIASVQDIINTVDSSTTGEAVTEQDLVLMGFSSIDDSGNTVYDFPTKFQFEINSPTPSHAAYYVCSFLNIEQLLEDNNLTTTSVNMTANQYAMNGEWITAVSSGELNSGESRISDFRDVNDIAPAYSVDLSQINLLDGLTSGAGQNFTTLPMYRHKYFSDIHLSTTSARECGFIFGFNQLDFMKDNSVYGRFFDNVADDIRDNVLKKCTIEEIKILRRRVKQHTQGASARGYPNIYEPWQGNQVDHIIATSKARRDGKVTSVRRVNLLKDGGSKSAGRPAVGGFREVNIGTNATNGKDFRTRHFTGKDSAVKNQTDGIYQYGVEITMRDYVPVFIGEQLSELKKQIGKLQEYEVFANIPVVNRYKQTYADPHVGNKRIDQQTKKAVPVVAIVGGASKANTGASTRTQVGFYDPMTNKFTQDFISFAGRKYSSSQPWARAPRAFVELLDFIVSEKMTAEQKNKMRKNLTGVCNPESGTPRGISSLIRMLEDYTKIVEDLISAQPITSNSSAASNPSTPNGGSGVTNRTVTYKTYFTNDAFNADAPPSTGVSFLGMSSAGAGSSIGIVSTGDYINRAKKEATKYFSSPSAVPVLGSAYKYLSAASINVLAPGNTVNLQTVNNRYDAGDQSEMNATLKNVVQYLGSKRKADQTRILTIDSKQRLGQAITPEFGVTLISAAEANHLIKGSPISPEGSKDSSVRRISSGASEGASATQSGILSSPVLTLIEQEEIDYAEVFPSAMATAEWSSQQSGEDVLDAFANLRAGFESREETDLLLRLLINTKRDFLHSTKQHPASSQVANFTPIAVVTFLIDAMAKASVNDLASLGSVATTLMGTLPISIQAAAGSANPSSTAVHDHIRSRMTQQYWDSPVYNILYQLHFMMTARVEYLAGYQESSMRPKYERSIGSEIWVPLTKAKVDLLHKDEGAQILCRMRPYSHEALRIAFPKALDMPIWNSKFLLVGNNDKPLAGIKRKIGMTAPAIQVIRKGLFT